MAGLPTDPEYELIVQLVRHGVSYALPKPAGPRQASLADLICAGGYTVELSGRPAGSSEEQSIRCVVRRADSSELCHFRLAVPKSVLRGAGERLLGKAWAYLDDE